MPTRSAKEIFADAAELPAAQRAGFLDRACAGDSVLRARVEALLKALDTGERFLVDPTRSSQVGASSNGAPAAAALQEGPGSTIGRYRLLQQIGEGGFGVVFMAEQREPVIRKVALKIIKLGMDTRQVIARFEAERQALAIMDHPSIAKVLDAGATDTGRPYFVMELVKGDPITHYCDTNNLPPRERLELFVQVCHAVQHAHSKGVIHRDLKPSNVLVTMVDGRPVPKIIDFGIAKATSSRLTEKTVFTEFRQLIGTPEYMSPEQAEMSGVDIDTRSDVYSLGVLLYELLTGVTPFDARKLRSAAWGELQRIIREEEPPRPSTRLSTMKEAIAAVAAHRRTEPARLSRLVRGDLDWVAMKCLEKDRTRRYPTANDLAADVERYLTGEAVSAAPPSARYRLKKFVRRHRAAVAAAIALAALLALGIVGTTWGMFQARRERDRARQAELLANERYEQAEKARADADRFNRIASAVTEFFTQDVLDLSPVPEGQAEPTIRQVLDRIPDKIDQYFKSEPAVEGVIRERVGQLYLKLGEPRRAADFLEAGVTLLEKHLGPEHRTTLLATQRLAELMLELERYDRAEELFGQAHRARLTVLGEDNNHTWNSLLRRGTARVYAGRTQEGLRDAEDAFAQIRTRRGPTSRTALIFASKVIECYRVAGRLDQAESLARESLVIIHANMAGQADAEMPFRAILGHVLLDQGRFQEALDELDPAYAAHLENYPSGHPDLLVVRENRALALAGLNRLDEARSELQQCHDAYARVYGADSPRCRRIAATVAQWQGSPGP
jgi:serine/threonine protein kinase